MQHDIVLFHLGKSDFTLGQLLAILIGIGLLLLVSAVINRVVVNRLLQHSHIDLSTRYTVAALVRYAVLVVGFMAVLQTAGINLSAFSVLAGAVGVGVGFGLQNIVSNFISGLIVMFERPVRIGDRIELGGIEGDVLGIGARATRLRTSEGCVVFMPNQRFITDPLKNWADANEQSPLVLNVNLDKSGDLTLASEVLSATVREHPNVVRKPATQVWLTSISGPAAFKILAWVSGGAEERNRITHELYLAIADRLAQHDIKMA